MKLNNLQALRAIAAYAVFFVHFEDIERNHGGAARLLGPWADIGAWGVDLFFVLSGFVMVLVSTEKAGSLRNAGAFIWSRASRIYPLWWLCLSAIVVIWVVKPGIVYGGADTNPNLLKDYLLIPRDRSPLLQTGWTLIHEMYFYVIFTGLLLLPIGHKGRLPILLGWGALITALSLIFNFQYGTLLALATHPMSLEFVMGALAAYAWKRFDGRAGFPILLLGIAWISAAICIELAQPNPERFADSNLALNWARTLMYGPGAAFLTYGAAGIEKRRNIRASGLSVDLGDWSYSLYLTHMLTVNAAGVVWAKVAQPGIWDNLIALPVILVFCTVCSWMTYRFFEQPVLRRTKAMGKQWFAATPPKTAGLHSAP